MNVVASVSPSDKRPYRLGRQEFSLGKNRNYQYVYRKGKSFPSRHIVLIFVPSRELKVGFSVSSKVGNAVNRNRLRRYFKEDFRIIRSHVKTGKYVFVARQSAKDAPHSVLTSHMKALFARAGLFDDGKDNKAD